ncbi:MAG: dihydrodipicolinate reductase [Spirochaetes bacterium]|nr:dihydrodipicolinate reductase [Spirochaetota bacterium]
MKVYIAGNGKLAESIINGLSAEFELKKWKNTDLKSEEKIILLHAGSGRQFDECLEYCNKTKSVLLELSTGGSVHEKNIDCPVILCPNTAIPVLKIMELLKQYGHEFSQYKINIIESHQENKTTIPGTAVELAEYFQMSAEKIISIRNPDEQIKSGIPEQHLGLHAYHNVFIKDTGCEISLQLKVLGHDAYVNGLRKILPIVNQGCFENRLYNITDILKK